MLNSFLIGRTWESRVPGGTRCFQLFVAGPRGNIEQGVDSDNDEQKSPTKIISLSRSLLICWIGAFPFERSVLKRDDAASERESRSGGPTLNRNGSAKAHKTKEYHYSDSNGGKQKSFLDHEPKTRLDLSAFASLTFATFIARGSRAPSH